MSDKQPPAWYQRSDLVWASPPGSPPGSLLSSYVRPSETLLPVTLRSTLLRSCDCSPQGDRAGGAGGAQRSRTSPVCAGQVSDLLLLPWRPECVVPRDFWQPRAKLRGRVEVKGQDGHRCALEARSPESKTQCRLSTGGF